MATKLWIDTDAGVDDAQAIFMALASPEVEIIALSTVRGNTNCRQVALNVLRLLKVAGTPQIPVYCGCEEALMGSKTDASYYHGVDGFGDVPDPDPPSADLIQEGHAVNALIQTVNKHKGDITLVCLGPLTNIALAIRMDPQFGKKLKTCYIMGGNYEGRGNATMAAEFNFYADPEAAHVVLNDLGSPITMACWELCLKHTFTWTWYKELYSVIPTIKGRFIKTIEEKTLSIYYESLKPEGIEYQTADQMIMAILLRPDIVTRSAAVYSTVVVSSGEARGQMLCDWSKVTKHPANVNIVKDINQQLYADMMLASLQ